MSSCACIFFLLQEAIWLMKKSVRCGSIAVVGAGRGWPCRRWHSKTRMEIVAVIDVWKCCWGATGWGWGERVALPFRPGCVGTHANNGDGAQSTPNPSRFPWQIHRMEMKSVYFERSEVGCATCCLVFISCSWHRFSTPFIHFGRLFRCREPQINSDQTYY